MLSIVYFGYFGYLGYFGCLGILIYFVFGEFWNFGLQVFWALYMHVYFPGGRAREPAAPRAQRPQPAPPPRRARAHIARARAHAHAHTHTHAQVHAHAHTRTNRRTRAHARASRASRQKSASPPCLRAQRFNDSRAHECHGHDSRAQCFGKSQRHGPMPRAPATGSCHGQGLMPDYDHRSRIGHCKAAALGLGAQAATR